MGNTTTIHFKALDGVSSIVRKISGNFPKLNRNVKKTANNFKILQKQTRSFRRSMKSAGASMKSVGTQMTIGLTAPIGLFAAATIKAGASFEAAMIDVGAKTSATTEEFKKMSDEAKRLGITTQFSASEAAEAETFLAQAGFNVKQIMESLEPTLQLAAAANMDLGRSADIVSNVLKGYGKETSELAAVNDILVRGINSANFNLEELSESLKVAGPMGASMNIEFKEMVAILGEMANAGFKSGEAGTALRNSISSLLLPSGQAKEALSRLKIKKSDIVNSAGKITSFKKVLDLLQKSGASAADMVQIFGKRMGPKLLPFLKDGVKGITELQKALGGTNKDGRSVAGAAEIAGKKMSGAQGGIKSMKSAFEGLKLAIGDSGVLKGFTKLVNKVAGFTRGLAKTNPFILKMGFIFGLVLAVIGPLVTIIGVVIAMLPALSAGFALLSAASLPITGTILAIVAAVAALIAIGFLVIKHWTTIKNFFIKMWNTPLVRLALFLTGIGGIILVVQKIMKHWEPIKQFFKDIFDFISDDVERFTNDVQYLIDLVKNSFLGKGFDFVNEKLKDIAPDFLFEKVGGEDSSKVNQIQKNIQERRETSTTDVNVNFANTPKGTRADVWGPAVKNVNMGFSGLGAL